MAIAEHRPWCPAGLLSWTPTFHDFDTVARYMGHNPSSFKDVYALTNQFQIPAIPADVIAVKAILKVINQE